MVAITTHKSRIWNAEYGSSECKRHTVSGAAKRMLALLPIISFNGVKQEPEKSINSFRIPRILSTNALTPSGRGICFRSNVHWLTPVIFPRVTPKVPRDEPRELGLELRLAAYELA